MTQIELIFIEVYNNILDNRQTITCEASITGVTYHFIILYRPTGVLLCMEAINCICA